MMKGGGVVGNDEGGEGWQEMVKGGGVAENDEGGGGVRGGMKWWRGGEGW